MTRILSMLFAAFIMAVAISTTTIAQTMDKYMQIQLLQNQVETLQAERAKQYEELSKCEKNTKAYKIAGISAVSAAGVGVLINIKLHKRLAELQGDGDSAGMLSDNRSPAEKDAASRWAILGCDDDDSYAKNQAECDKIAAELGV